MRSELIALTAYPLSRNYLVGLRKKLGRDFDQITLSELRQHGGLRLLAALRDIRPHTLLLPVEDENGAVLLPIVRLLAGLTGARKIAVFRPGGDLEQVSIKGIIWDLCRFAFASFACALSAIWAWVMLKRLLVAPRMDCSPSEKHKRILYLKTNLWFGIKAGGSVGHIAGVANAFQNMGLPVTFASAEPPVMVDTEVEIRKIAPPKTFGAPYEFNNYRFQRFFARDANRILAAKGFNLIYQRISAANFLGIGLSRSFQLPLIVEYNGSEVWVAKHWGRPMRFHALADMAEKAMLRHAHLIVTISEVLKDELIANGVEPARIVCYPNCIDPQVFDPQRFSAAERNDLRRRYGISPNATVVAFIGTFGLWHGAEVLAKAIARLYAQDRDWLAKHQVHFLLIGDGQKMPQVRATIEGSGADAVCTLAGLVPQEQAALHLAAADILASPHVPNSDGTRFFGSPTKLFEYMAMAKGIVASNLDQIGEVLSPGLLAGALPSDPPEKNSPELAVLVKPGDVTDLIQGLRFLIERTDWRAHLGMMARIQALKKYTWNHHVKAILKGMEHVAPH